MHAATKRLKVLHPIRHLRGNSHSSRKKSPRLTHKIHNLYASSIKSIKKKPYKTGGILLSLGVVASGIYYWYRFIK